MAVTDENKNLVLR